MVDNNNIGIFCILASTIQKFFLTIWVLGNKNSSIIGAKALNDGIFGSIPLKLIQLTVSRFLEPKKNFSDHDIFGLFTNIGIKVLKKKKETYIIRTTLHFGNRKIMNSMLMK